MDDSIRILPMEHRHLESVVDLHQEAFPRFFLTQFGRPFLYFLYRGYLRQENLSRAWVAVETNHDNLVVGFVCGTTQPRDFYRSLLLSLDRSTLWHLVRLLLTNISIWRIAWRKLRMRIFQSEGYVLQGAELSSIAVSSRMRGKQIGQKLVSEFINGMAALNVESVYLTTDKYENDSVNFFYLKNGWILEKEIPYPDGRVMNVYRLNLYDPEKKT